MEKNSTQPIVLRVMAIKHKAIQIAMQTLCWGDLPLDELTSYIELTMPEEDPESVTGKDAAAVSKYLYDKFYSRSAQRNRPKPRIELSRLTVRQYKTEVADLIGQFIGSSPIPTDRGLNATYYAASGANEEFQSRMVYAGPNQPIAAISNPYRMFEKMYGKLKDRENLVSVLASLKKEIQRSKEGVAPEDLKLLDSHQQLVDQMGRFVKVKNVSTTRLWLAIAHAMGHQIEQFGLAALCKEGPVKL